MTEAVINIDRYVADHRTVNINGCVPATTGGAVAMTVTIIFLL